jgi:hypothetical protein
VNGAVTNLLVQRDDFATVGAKEISPIDADSFWVDAYFEETKLGAIRRWPHRSWARRQGCPPEFLASFWWLQFLVVPLRGVFEPHIIVFAEPSLHWAIGRG